MQIENPPVTALEMWSNILRTHVPAIVAVSGAHYFPHAHGESGYNIPLPEHKGLLLEAPFSLGQVPSVEMTLKRGVPLPNRLGHAMFAIASPFFIWTGEGGDPRQQRVNAYTLCSEQGRRLSELQRHGLIRPNAMVMVDFDCPRTERNFGRIIEALSSNPLRKSRYLLGTTHGFHMVEDDGVDVNTYPWHIGRMISEFVPTAPQNRRHIIQAFADELMMSNLNASRLRRWASEVPRTFVHYDGSKKGGISFIIDMLNLGHAMNEYCDYREREDGGFGFLRVNGKRGDEAPPFVLARQRGRNIRTFGFSWPRERSLLLL